jgi:hypothetical protein
MSLSSSKSNYRSQACLWFAHNVLPAAADPLYCEPCAKQFTKQSVFDGHLPGKKHVAAAKKFEADKATREVLAKKVFFEEVKVSAVCRHPSHPPPKQSLPKYPPPPSSPSWRLLLGAYQRGVFTSPTSLPPTLLRERSPLLSAYLPFSLSLPSPLSLPLSLSLCRTLADRRNIR